MTPAATSPWATRSSRCSTPSRRRSRCPSTRVPDRNPRASDHAAVKAQIKILGGGRKGATAVFSKPELLVGRHPAADIRFDPDLDLDVSSRHAQMDYRDGDWYVRDLGSSNGTYVNGHPIKAITRLDDTDH